MKKTYIFLFFLLCSCAAAVAQNLREFSVTSFEEKPFDTAARDDRYRLVDGNGDLFSIIKLVAATPDDDLRAYSFDFGLPESRVKSVDGDVWVYVQRNAMRVTVKREGFKTVRYDLPVTVQPGQVFEMTLRATPIVVKKRHLLFQVTPVDSKAYIQYKAEGENDYRTLGDGQVGEDGMLSDKLVLGRYFYKITSKNYHLSEGVIELTDEDGTFTESVTLRPNFGTLVLTAVQDGGIYIDGDSIGIGTCTANLAPGYYNVECRKAGHRSVVESIEVKVGDTIEVALKTPVPITGALDIVSSPLKATITIDGKECGKTPAEIKELLIGSHSVELSKDGYIPQTLTVNVEENETTELNVTLIKDVDKDEDVNSEPQNSAKTDKQTDKDSRNNKTVAETAKAEPVPAKATKKEKLASAVRKNAFRRQVNCFYLEPTGGAGHLMEAGLNLGCYLSMFNMEFYGYHGLQTHSLYSATREYVVAPVSFGGRIGVGIQAGKCMAFTPQLGMGGLLVYGDEICVSTANASLGLRCELFFGKHFGMSITPEYIFPVGNIGGMRSLRIVSPTIEGWCRGFNARVGFHFNF